MSRIPGLVWLAASVVAVLAFVAGSLTATRTARHDAGLAERVRRLEQAQPITHQARRSTQPTAHVDSVGWARPGRGDEISRDMAEARAESNHNWRSTETAFARESRLQPWAAESESGLRDIVLGAAMERLDRPDDLSINCRSRSCRISARFATRSLAEDWSQILPVAAGQTLPRTVSRILVAADGTFEVRVYGSAR